MPAHCVFAPGGDAGSSGLTLSSMTTPYFSRNLPRYCAFVWVSCWRRHSSRTFGRTSSNGRVLPGGGRLSARDARRSRISPGQPTNRASSENTAPREIRHRTRSRSSERRHRGTQFSSKVGSPIVAARSFPPAVEINTSAASASDSACWRRCRVEENLREGHARFSPEALGVCVVELAQLLVVGLDDARRVVDEERELLR